MNKVQAAARRRVDDSHKAQMLKLQEVTGNAFDLTEDTEDEEVAISVQGDTTYNQQPTTSSAAKVAAAALTAASLPLAGIGVYEMLGNNQPTPPQPPAAIVQPAEDQDTYVPYNLSIE